MIDTTLVGRPTVASVVPSTTEVVSSSMKSGLPPATSLMRSSTAGDGVLLEQLAGQLLGCVLTERVDRERGVRREPAAEARPFLEELGTGRRQEEDRRVPHASGEVLDEIQQRGFGPVEILEADDGGLLRAERFHEASHRVEEHGTVLRCTRTEPGDDRERLGEALGVDARKRTCGPRASRARQLHRRCRRCQPLASRSRQRRRSLCSLRTRGNGRGRPDRHSPRRAPGTHDRVGSSRPRARRGRRPDGSDDRRPGVATPHSALRAHARGRPSVPMTGAAPSASRPTPRSRATRRAILLAFDLEGWHVLVSDRATGRPPCANPTSTPSRGADDSEP